MKKIIISSVYAALALASSTSYSQSAMGIASLSSLVSGRQHLVQQHKIAANVLKANGLGSGQLKDVSQATSQVNRQVHFSTLAQS
ncbi:MAG: hypothetical protein QM533_06290 [Cytophagales bacterium]|nr:hypothetical protein [Cytophagales bacterium]